MSVHKADAINSTARGSLRYRLYEPMETGIQNQDLAAGATSNGNQICVEGFEHFQFWVTTLTLPSTLELRIGATHPDPGQAFGTFTNAVIATIAISGAGQGGTAYFGAEAAPAASSAGDTWRVGRFIRLSVRNAGAGLSQGINVYLEATG